MESNNKGLLFGSNTHNTEKELFAQDTEQSRYLPDNGILNSEDDERQNGADEKYENNNPGGAGGSGSAANNEENDH